MSREDAGSIARTVTDHPYRRILFSILDNQTEPVSVRSLARAILVFDRSGVTVSADDSLLDEDAAQSSVETMAAQLHHVHLPRLVSAGLVEYDENEGIVRDWSHPAVGERWLTAPPIGRLAGVIADARKTSLRAD